jgi:hypothetical protein
MRPVVYAALAHAVLFVTPAFAQDQANQPAAQVGSGGTAPTTSQTVSSSVQDHRAEAIAKTASISVR